MLKILYLQYYEIFLSTYLKKCPLFMDIFIKVMLTIISKKITFSDHNGYKSLLPIGIQGAL